MALDVGVGLRLIVPGVPYGQQGNAQIADLGEHAVQGCLICNVSAKQHTVAWNLD